MQNTALEIDGSYGEGGGAIVRTAVGLSILTQKPIHITNIRTGRKQPGLKTQHLEGLKAATELCGGELKGAELGSKEIEFAPSRITATELSIKIPTAGSVGLVLQVLQLACVRAPHRIKIEIEGGADFGKFAPSVPYLQAVTLEMLRRMGYKIDVTTLKHGFYPVGGGRTEIVINPAKKLNPINLKEQGEIQDIKGVSIAEKRLEKARVADRQAEAASKAIEDNLRIKPRIDKKYAEADCPGSGIVIWAKTSSGAILGGDAIGERGVPAEKVGEAAARGFLEDIKAGGAVDRHALDQLIPFLALAAESGESAIKYPVLTPHTETNIWLAKRFLPVEFEIDKGKQILRIFHRK